MPGAGLLAPSAATTGSTREAASSRAIGAGDGGTGGVNLKIDLAAGVPRPRFSPKCVRSIFSFWRKILATAVPGDLAAGAIALAPPIAAL